MGLIPTIAMYRPRIHRSKMASFSTQWPFFDLFHQKAKILNSI